MIISASEKELEMQKAERRDFNQILSYLDRDPYFNLFMISEMLNKKSESFQIFCSFEDGLIVGVLLKSDRHYNLFFEKRTAILDFSDKLNHEISETPNAILAGEQKQVETILESVKSEKRKTIISEFSICQKLLNVNTIDNLNIQETSKEDVEEVSELLTNLPEFGSANAGTIRSEIETGFRKTCHIRVSGKIVSTASCVAETDKAGMIIAVGTAESEEFRRKGYATACVSFLVEKLLKKGKTACIFYDNPVAGNIYKRIGFKKIGTWITARF